MKLLIDMNLSPAWLDFLSGDFEAVHWREIGASDARDEEIFKYAQRHQFCVFTNDLDFGAILAVSGAHGPSVVQLRNLNLDPSVVGARVVDCLKLCQVELSRGALVSIDLDKMRIRTLPIGR